MREKRLHLNLARSPVRNRRLFLGLTGLLAGAFLIFAAWGSIMFLHFSMKTRELRVSLAEMQNKTRDIEREETRISRRIEDFSRENQRHIDFLNGIIYQKTFSWVDLLSRFEKALPDDSHLVSMRPVIMEDLSLNLSFEFACRDMKGLLDFINRLRGLGFSNIRLLKETRGERGRTHYELVVRYDRAG